MIWVTILIFRWSTGTARVLVSCYLAVMFLAQVQRLLRAMDMSLQWIRLTAALTAFVAALILLSRVGGKQELAR